jgi:hypothetical protein
MLPRPVKVMTKSRRKREEKEDILPRPVTIT